METKTPRTDAANYDAISMPSLKNLLAYLNYQYPTTKGNLPLNDLCERISQLELELTALTKERDVLLKEGKVGLK